jgi:putative ABC transport system substrate-binding protein
MRARWHVLLTLLLCGLAPTCAAAEPRPYHVMLLLFRGCEEACQGFQDYFRRQNVPVRFTLHDAAQDKRRIAGFVEEARRTRPDLVVAWGTSVALEAAGQWDAVDPARHITDIPVVFMAVTDPVRSRLTPSLDGSGRNVAGTRYLLSADEQLRAARMYLDFRRVGFLYNPAEPNSTVSLEEVRAAASRLGAALVVETLRLDAAGRPDPAAIPGHFAALAKAGVDLFYASPDSFINSRRKEITAAAIAHRLPVFAAAEALVAQADGLFGVVVRYDVMGRFTARLALRILQEGQQPGSLPVALPRHFSYLINLRTAHLLERYPPLPLLDVAEFVGNEEGTP